MIADLNKRSRDILRLVVEGFVETGEPVGSRTLARKMEMSLSPATIRNAMADLEDAGLLYSPHTSAGRLPTDAGLRLFVDGLLEVGGLSSEDRQAIEAQCATSNRSVTQLMEDAGNMMSGLSRCAGLVYAPKSKGTLKHIEFVPLGPGRALVVMVMENGIVENRVIDLPVGLPSSVLIEATNFLVAKLVGQSLEDAQAAIRKEVREKKAALDELTARVVEQGLATWADVSSGDGILVVRGQANLLEDMAAVEDLERIRQLFTALEGKENLLRLLDAADTADGVQIFIGSENSLFSMAGWSTIVAPYQDQDDKIIGAIGVIGPTRMNYARIIPMVDYTSKIVGKLLSGS